MYGLVVALWVVGAGWWGQARSWAATGECLVVAVTVSWLAPAGAWHGSCGCDEACDEDVRDEDVKDEDVKDEDACDGCQPPTPDDEAEER